MQSVSWLAVRFGSPRLGCRHQRRPGERARRRPGVAVQRAVTDDLLDLPAACVGLATRQGRRHPMLGVPAAAALAPALALPGH